MADLKSIIKDEIVKYILSCESTIDPSNWYVGITGQDPNERKKQHESEKILSVSILNIGTFTKSI